MELVNAESAEKEILVGKDTKTIVTILDDDNPGFLSFKEKRANVKHAATDPECTIVVERTNGSDGSITVCYKTLELTQAGDRMGKKGIDFTHIEGKLTFGHNETEKEIVVPILKREDENEDTVRDEIFGVKLFDADPSIVKISKKDTCIVEIVTDAERKKQAEAL